MSYIKENVLRKDEKILKTVELHPLRLIGAWILGVLFCWLIFPLIKAIKTTVEYNTTEMVVTERAVIEKRGWLNTVCDEMGLDKIENITTNQTFWGKIFGYGNVCIQGTNRNNILFVGIKKHEAVRKFINELREN